MAIATALTPFTALCADEPSSTSATFSLTYTFTTSRSATPIDVGNVAWLTRVVDAASLVGESEQRARGISVAVAGAQLITRIRSDVSHYDVLIDSFRAAGLLPA